MSRRGIALLLAVAALAALGTITATAFSLAQTERAVGIAALAEVQALGAAEAAVAEALRGWPRARTPVLPGEELALGAVSCHQQRRRGWSVIRALGGPIFALRAWGVRRDGAGNPLAERRVELLVRLDSTGSGDSIRPRVDPRGWQGLVP